MTSGLEKDSAYCSFGASQISHLLRHSLTYLQPQTYAYVAKICQCASTKGHVNDDKKQLNLCLTN